ncbi:hypothetical protein OCOJLMKI_0171 [Methylobacterium iners]|uniref:Uncharacterized protein n=1 Tax=Methylobacterium iners TaxID=418707 RepID=A0ABQ4RQF6_9HYPH|nr:hypothetical protein OCOJLMKI_0171 [Methylobacterium iners]
MTTEGPTRRAGGLKLSRRLVGVKNIVQNLSIPVIMALGFALTLIWVMFLAWAAYSLVSFLLP